MTRWIFIAGMLVALTTVAATAAAPEEQHPAKPPKASSPIISLKANMGDQKVEMAVEQTDDGMSVSGTLNEETISATGTTKPDGTVHVKVTKDEGTVIEMTINPEALRKQASPPTPKTKP